MPTLKEAQKKPSAMKKFVDEHADLEIDGERFDRVIRSMTTQDKPSEDQSDDFLDGSDGYT